MTQYELNQMIIEQRPSLSPEELSDKQILLNEWGRDKTFSMLYGKDISYFTLFQKTNILVCNSFGKVVMDCLHDLTNNIYAIDLLENNAIEIWINYENKAMVLYLFDYSQGLVQYA